MTSKRVAVLALCLLSVCCLKPHAEQILVPFDYPTITDACEVAVSGDTVGVYPGQYFEHALVQPGVTIRGITSDSLLVWVRGRDGDDPFWALPGEEQVVLEKMQLWGGRYCVVATACPLLIQNCFLFARDDNEPIFRYVVSAGADFVVRNCYITFSGDSPDPFEIWEPVHAVMQDCVFRGDIIQRARPGMRWELINNSIVGSLYIDPYSEESTHYTLSVVNCIMERGVCVEEPDTVEWRYNDFIAPGGWPDCGYQVGNFSADPLYCDPWPADPADYRLEPQSPCVGAGENGEDVGARLGICWDPASTPESPGHRSRFQVSSPSPNPTNGRVTLLLSVSPNGPVAVEVLDVSGRVLRILRRQEVRDRTIAWDGLLDGDRPAPSGVYYLRLRAGSEVTTKRVVVAR